MTCPGCGVAEGRWHVAGCDWEQCPYCGRHLALCRCPRPPLDDRIPWDGSCCWLDACLELGLFARQVAGRWAPCRPGEPGCQPDVVRLLRRYRWNRAEKRFER